MCNMNVDHFPMVTQECITAFNSKLRKRPAFMFTSHSSDLHLDDDHHGKLLCYPHQTISMTTSVLVTQVTDQSHRSPVPWVHRYRQCAACLPCDQIRLSPSTPTLVFVQHEVTLLHDDAATTRLP